tara:strand:- start:705 stop:1031 length:327 start_codon:yes stop_codon:yes gene_type:complete
MKLSRQKLRQIIIEAYSRNQLRQRDTAIKTYVKNNYRVDDIFESLSAYHGTGEFFDAAHQESFRIAKEVQTSGVFPYTDPHQLIKMIAKTLLVDLFSLHRQWLNKTGQ